LFVAVQVTKRRLITSGPIGNFSNRRHVVDALEVWN